MIPIGGKTEREHTIMKTDKELRDDIIAELRWEPSLNAEQIGVETRDGVVTLGGHVNSYVEKWIAEEAAQRVSGLRALAIEMEVNLPGPSLRHDADIASAVRNILEWNTVLPEASIKIQVEDGWVTLSGTVAWQHERRAAVEAVRHLMGVKGLSNNISLKSTVSATGVKADILGALKRRAVVDSQKITVDVEGAEVTLSGTVDNWPECELARRTALNTAGVDSVKNNIMVVF
jgi:osmotically-inducible protein OsmY